VVEVIDYDFGIVEKHGIFRDIPGLSLESKVLVESDSAPDGIADRTPSTSPGSPG